MFPYDATILTAVRTSPESVNDVLEAMQTIDATCADGDGLKWFNWLYLRVTQAVQARVNSGEFSDSDFMTALDVQFAGYYFAALAASLSGGSAPGCWQAMFDQRSQIAIARIQFAIAGINAHINHDLPEAVVATCRASGIMPQHGTPQYTSYTALNATLDSLINTAKQELNFRLLGDELPAISHLNATLETWSVSAARETAWNNAEILWQLSGTPLLSATFLQNLDSLTELASRALLVPVPMP
jgi:Family of unknown function (DUF5995)